MAATWGKAFSARLDGRAGRAGGIRALCLVICALLTACDGVGPVFPTSDALEGWVRAPGAVDPRSDRAPVLAGDTVRFHLRRGERRTALRAGREWGVRQTYLLGFDLRIEPQSLPRRPVDLTRLVRTGGDEAEIVAVALDRRNGVSVLGRRCIAPEALGAWHRVEIRIEFSDRDTGFLEVFCDRRPIWAQSHMRTTLPPVCRRAEGCNAPVPGPVGYEWQVGVIAPGRVARDLAVEMRRIFYHRLFVIPHRVGAL